jgi:hypothetical protein
MVYGFVVQDFFTVEGGEGNEVDRSIVGLKNLIETLRLLGLIFHAVSIKNEKGFEKGSLGHLCAAQRFLRFAKVNVLYTSVYNMGRTEAVSFGCSDRLPAAKQGKRCGWNS